MTEELHWDSEIFGFKVAKILAAQVDTKTLGILLADLKTQGVKLVYWASKNSDDAAKAHHGLLVDRKLTYVMDLPATAPVNNVESYTAELPTPELEELALESGNYSRFKIDPKISQAQFETIYRAWITNSTKKLIAHDVLVIKKDNHIAGFVTLGEKQGRGDIGLLAVAAPYRGLGFGKDLVYAALAKFIEQGYSQSQVVTQADNLAACRLYEQCGYQVEKVENFYHFWI